MVGRLLAGKCAGLTAAALLGLGPNYAEFAARIVADIPALTFTLAGLALSIVAFTRRRPGVAVAEGAVLTAAVSIELTAVTVVPIIRAALTGLSELGCATSPQPCAEPPRPPPCFYFLTLARSGRCGMELSRSIARSRTSRRCPAREPTGINCARPISTTAGLCSSGWTRRGARLPGPLLRRRWSLWPLWLWTAAAAVAVEQTRPLQANHYTLLSAAIALPAGASIGALLASIPRGSVQTVAGIAITALIAAGYVHAGEHLAGQSQPDGPEVAWSIANLRSHSRPDEFVATDRPILAYLADRRLPGDLVDTSFLRFETRSLTPSAVLEPSIGTRWQSRLAPANSARIRASSTDFADGFRGGFDSTESRPTSANAEHVEPTAAPRLAVVTVSAVIPHRNSGDLLEQCVDALLSASGLDEIIIADEASTDGSVERVASRPGVRVVESKRRGFAAAMNVGVEAARGDQLLLLNSDAFVRPDTVERLRRHLDQNPRLALCGAALVNPDGTRTLRE